MRVFLTGGTGLIGRRLVGELISRGDVPVILSRQADRARLNPSLKGCEIVQGDPSHHGGWEAAVDGCEAVINLVGQNLFAKRWSAEVKREIRDSRVVGTENLVSAIARATNRPKVFVQASAIGYYGPHGDEELTESSPPGNDFMAEVCRVWEEAAKPAEGLGVRVATVRTGVVLAKGEGALGVMTPIFRYGPGAPIGGGMVGKGQQWMSWIHLEDIAGIFLLALDNAEAKGPINGTAPNPVRNIDFSRAMTRAVGPIAAAFIPFGPPDFALKLALGEVADVVTKGQKVLPARAKALGYTFRFPELSAALADLFPKKAKVGKPVGASVGS